MAEQQAGKCCGTAAEEQMTDHSLQIGEQYFMRCITFYYIGRLTAVTKTDLVLADVTWVIDTGEDFSEFLFSGVIAESSHFLHDVILSRDTVLETTKWNHGLLNDTSPLRVSQP